MNSALRIAAMVVTAPVIIRGLVLRGGRDDGDVSAKQVVVVSGAAGRAVDPTTNVPSRSLRRAVDLPGARVHAAARLMVRRSGVCRLAALVAVTVLVTACTFTGADDQLIDSPPTDPDESAFWDGMALDVSVSLKKIDLMQDLAQELEDELADQRLAS